MPGACGEAEGPGLLFFGGVGEGWLRRGMGEEAGDELIGEFAEGEVDLRLQGGEGSRVPRELLGPELLLGGEVGSDLLDGLVRRRDVGPLPGVESNTHGWSSRRGTSPLLSTIARRAANGFPFWEWTRPDRDARERRRRWREAEPLPWPRFECL